MIDAYVGVGGNMGDRAANVAAGVAAVAELPTTHLIAVSRAYETEPWGAADQGPYVNAVAHIRTDLYADQLLALLQDAEERLGRTPGERFGPRVVDLDILLFGDEEWASETLTIPHPRMAEREFVIRPLLEIAPEVQWPDGSFVTDADVRVGRVIGDLGPLPGFEQLTPQPPSPRHAGPPPGAEPDLGPADFRGPVVSGDFRVPGRRETFTTETGEEWVPLGVSQTDPSPGALEMLFYEAVLQDAGVPCVFYPNRPNEGAYGPYWVPRFVDLFVTVGRLDEARELIRQARRAPNAEE